LHGLGAPVGLGEFYAQNAPRCNIAKQYIYIYIYGKIFLLPGFSYSLS